MPGPDNPFETPRPNGTRVIQAALRVGVAIQCFGLAAAWLHQGRSTAFTIWMAEVWEPTAAQVQAVENSLAFALVLCGLVSLVRPMSFLLIPLAIYQGAIAACAGPQSITGLPLAETAQYAARTALPLALLLTDFWPPHVRPSLALYLTSILLLRIAVATTFIAHGVIALWQSQKGGPAIDFVVAALKSVTTGEIPAVAAQRSLALFGAVSIGLAIGLLCARSRMIAFLLSLLGFATAYSWTLAYGTAGYDSTLVRAPDAMAPLTILLFWLTAVREQGPVFVPESNSG